MSKVGAENSRVAARSGRAPTVRCRVERFDVASVPRRTGVKHLVAESGSIYELIRTLKPTLTGKVKYACLSRRGPDGTLVRDPATTFAIKVYHKTCVETRTNIHHAKILEDPREEWRLWHHLSNPGHPNVAKMIELMEDDTKIYCVMEYIEGGELFDRMASGPMSRAEARKAAFGVVSAVHYMHERGVCHRDLSLENFMLSKDGTVKVIDFGQSKPWILSPFAAVTVGKKGTRAPEVYRRLPHDGRAVDMWAIGSVIFTILTTLPPYETVGDSFYTYLVRQGARNLLTHWKLVNTMDPEALDLVHRLLCPDVAKRLSAEDAFQSPWFTEERKAAEARAAKLATAGEFKSSDKAGSPAERDTCTPPPCDASVPEPMAVATPHAPTIEASPSMEESIGMDGVECAGDRTASTASTDGDADTGALRCTGGGGGGRGTDSGSRCGSRCDSSVVDGDLGSSSGSSLSGLDSSFRSSTSKARSDSSVDYADYVPSVRSVSVDTCVSADECSASFDAGSPEPPSRQHSGSSVSGGMEMDQPREGVQPTANAVHIQNPPRAAKAVREESCVSLMSVGEAQTSPLPDTSAKAQMGGVRATGFAR